MNIQSKLVINLKILFLSATFLFLVSCTSLSSINDPVDLLWDKSDEKSDSLIIFLPGLYGTAETFIEEDIFKIARNEGIKADMLAAGIHLGHLIKKKVISKIEIDIFQTEIKDKYKNIWFVGISLGGLNSLLYFKKHENELCGVVTLSPYLGNVKLVNRIQQSGDIKTWQAKSVENNNPVNMQIESLWRWLRKQDNLSRIYLGYGNKDRYVDGQQLFSQILNENNVTVIEGKHNWKTTREIWQQQLMKRKKTGLLQPCH